MQRPTERRRTVTCIVILALPIGLSGCALLPPISFIDPTKVLSNPFKVTETGIRRALTARDKGPGIENATEPTPDDLIPPSQEYRIGPGDVVAVSIDELIYQGQMWAAQLDVTNTGYIDIPLIGPVSVQGMTEDDVRRELAERIRDAGLLPSPIVQVIIQVKQNYRFSILGNVTVAGTYPIGQPDLRLLEAIAFARDIGPSVRKLYVIRQIESDTAVPPAQPGQQQPPIRPEGLIIPPPTEEGNRNSGGTFFADGGWATRADGRAGPAAGDSRLNARQDTAPAPGQSELEELIRPSREGQQPATQDAPGGDRFPPVIFDPITQEPVEARPPRRPSTAPQAPAAPREFAWEDVPDFEPMQRTIEIDVPALRSGDARQNIVIRNRDVIHVPIDTGLFYVMGEVNRPGVFSLNDRDVTIKQAIGAIAGGFAPLAWPAQTEIIRRERGTDKQITIPVNLDAVFAGLEDDILIQDDDLINVGSHTVAPFLFVIRNSFRFTYGFGFVYDRNFADKDAYFGRTNPETRRDLERQTRGLPF